jgi:hypothetical protein
MGVYTQFQGLITCKAQRDEEKVKFLPQKLNNTPQLKLFQNKAFFQKSKQREIYDTMIVM